MAGKAYGVHPKGSSAPRETRIINSVPELVGDTEAFVVHRYD